MVMEMAADFYDAEARKAWKKSPLLSSPITDTLLSMQNRVLLGELVVEQGKGKETVNFRGKTMSVDDKME